MFLTEGSQLGLQGLGLCDEHQRSSCSPCWRSLENVRLEEMMIKLRVRGVVCLGIVGVATGGLEEALRDLPSPGYTLQGTLSGSSQWAARSWFASSSTPWWLLVFSHTLLELFIFHFCFC